MRVMIPSIVIIMVNMIVIMIAIAVCCPKLFVKIAIRFGQWYQMAGLYMQKAWRID